MTPDAPSHGRRAIRRAVARALPAVAVALAAAAPANAAPALRINQLQTIGSHNSYHLEPSPAEKALRAGSGLIDETTLEYSFAPLAWQLDREDVRQLELDLWDDPQGALYAAPRLRALVNGGPYAAAMTQPGIKVLHVQDYDYRTSCLTFVACLREVERWSDAYPWH